jgi:hypothetical protein
MIHGTMLLTRTQIVARSLTGGYFGYAGKKIFFYVFEAEAIQFCYIVYIFFLK